MERIPVSMGKFHVTLLARLQSAITESGFIQNVLLEQHVLHIVMIPLSLYPVTSAI